MDKMQHSHHQAPHLQGGLAKPEGLFSLDLSVASEGKQMPSKEEFRTWISHSPSFFLHFLIPFPAPSEFS